MSIKKGFRSFIDSYLMINVTGFVGRRLSLFQYAIRINRDFRSTIISTKYEVLLLLSLSGVK